MKAAALFQKATAEYAFRRMWIDRPSAHRFLVADEVGLGKTVVAREIVTKTLKRLGGRAADIIYVCSSRAIASQNLDKLKGEHTGAVSLSTRLTLLATTRRAATEPVRFLALTPNTSFELGNRNGWVTERALIWVLLRSCLRPEGLETALQIVKQTSWDHELQELRRHPPDDRIATKFRRAVISNHALVDRLRDLARNAIIDPNNQAFRLARRELVGELRAHLARASIRALSKRGLVILDEFQRFADLLKDAGPSPRLAVELVGELFSRMHRYRRVLLLSATPYRMPGLQDNPGEKPHADLVELAHFLTGSEALTTALDSELTRYARALQAGSARQPDILAARDAAQGILSQIMARTERISMTEDGDAMVQEEVVELPVRAVDLKGGIAARRLARRLGSHDPTEYWKSAPYIVEFMREYDLKRRALKLHRDGKRWVHTDALRGGLLLNRDQLKKFASMNVPNPRVRELIHRNLPPGAEFLLWIPPTMPYIEPAGAFEGARQDLKALVFSEWNLAPEAISALVSYEVERRLVRAARSRRGKSEKVISQSDYTSLGDHLRLGSLRGEAADLQSRGLAPLALLYPSSSLAEAIDPLKLAVHTGRPMTALEARRIASAIVREKLKEFRVPGKRAGRQDDRWYWAAPVLLDKRDAVLAWLSSVDPFGFVADAAAERPEVSIESQRFMLGVRGVLDGSLRLGRPPDDLAKVVASLALAAPGICALRALRRTFDQANGVSTSSRRAAFRIARGFQSMFNQPEAALAISLRTSRRLPYWRQALAYCLAGNVQSLLDEQCHIEADGLSLLGGTPAKHLEAVAGTVASTMRLRYARIEVAGLGRRRRKPGVTTDVDREAVAMRGRHAVRFAEIREEDGTVTRLDAVREAFNSPFRPFILASTSIGQEGLDFHPWCHTVCHWNLPRGPVELEQREGRVHRYKGHAVRLNVAKATGLAMLAERGLDPWGDPWAAMFEFAGSMNASDLAPCWIFDECEAPVRVRRTLLLPSLSREAEIWPLLKRRLALYRLVLGQPRQEDLLAALERGDITEVQAREWRIDLSPVTTARRSAVNDERTKRVA